MNILSAFQREIVTITHIARCRPYQPRRKGEKPRLVEAWRHPENPLYWVWQTPVKRAVLIDSSRYTPEKLRAIRKERGVGRPLEVLHERLQKMQAERPGAEL